MGLFLFFPAFTRRSGFSRLFVAPDILFFLLHGKEEATFPSPPFRYPLSGVGAPRRPTELCSLARREKPPLLLFSGPIPYYNLPFNNLFASFQRAIPRFFFFEQMK